VTWQATLITPAPGIDAVGRTHEERGGAVRVILIGGAPLSGKTAAARVIGERCSMPVISTDHLGEAARAVTTPASHGDLHACAHIDYREYYTSKLPERLLDEALRAHRALWPAIEAVIRRHLEWAGPLVIEGWALLPDLVATIQARRLGAVWLEAPEPTMRLRLQAEGDFVRGAADPGLLVERFVSRSVRMSEWLRQQASARGLPYVMLSGRESPHDVASRCLDAMGLVHAAAEHYPSADVPNAVLPGPGAE
jgi:2-phosphoglycerate kinase